MAWKNMAKAILTGVVKSLGNGNFVLYTESVDSKKTVYKREFPIRGNGQAEQLKPGDWISAMCDLVFVDRKTQLQATAIKPAKDGQYGNVGRLLGVAQSGFRYFKPKQRPDGSWIQPFARGLVTMETGEAFRGLLFDNPLNLAMEFSEKALPGSTICLQGRVQYGREFDTADGEKDAILEIVGTDPAFTRVLAVPKIVDPFLAWGGAPKEAPKAQPQADPKPQTGEDNIPF